MMLHHIEFDLGVYNIYDMVIMVISFSQALIDFQRTDLGHT